MDTVKSNYSFEEIKLKRLEFSALSDDQARAFNEAPGRISLSNSVDETKLAEGIAFDVSLAVEVFNCEDVPFLVVEMEGRFLADSDMSPEFAERVTSLQAPAILFPYIRQFVSIVTLNSNLAPLTLPLINLRSVFQQSKQE